MANGEDVRDALAKLVQYRLPEREDAHHTANLESPHRAIAKPATNNRYGLCLERSKIRGAPRTFANPTHGRSVAPQPKSFVRPIVDIKKVKIFKEATGILAHARLEAIAEFHSDRH